MEENQLVVNHPGNIDWRITEKIFELKTRGYHLKFRREATCLFCFEFEQWIMPGQFSVDESYYFEENSNPDGDRILYAITLSWGSRGFLIDACNVYSDNISPEMREKLKFNGKTSFKDDTSQHGALMEWLARHFS